ncbi:MAG: hypothetical protein AB8G22_28105 [Saprospiraceae bacterium]
MKKILLLCSFLSCLLIFSTTTTSCNRGTGCPATDNAHVKPNRKGELPKKRGKSALFPKDMKKKKKKRG